MSWQSSRRSERGDSAAGNSREAGPVALRVTTAAQNAPQTSPQASPEQAPIRIDIWSDIACPWCYIGKRKLESGIEQFSASGDAPAVEIEYHSYELSPDTPIDFHGSTTEYLAERKGLPLVQVEQMLDRVTGIANDVGLDYDFDSVQHVNTVRAHELIHFAKANGRQLEAKERLLKAYFVEGQDLSDIAVLADLAEELGLDRAAAVHALEERVHHDDVLADQQQAQAYGIQGVPFFVIDGKYGVSGAQEAATFADVLAKITSDREEANA
ncbi:disulfide bond formation protein DsbA [Pseudoclavibacter sp. RFBA6]|nr:disulfide bond formation protein DsbA [Pseudoclavibacter sp. RFBA6]